MASDKLLAKKKNKKRKSFEVGAVLFLASWIPVPFGVFFGFFEVDLPDVIYWISLFLALVGFVLMLIGLGALRPDTRGEGWRGSWGDSSELD